MSATLLAADVEFARREAEAALDAAGGVCKVLRVDDAAGVQTWTAKARVPCLIANPRQGGAAAAMVGRLGNDAAVVAYVPVATAVREGERLRDERGREFEVVFVPTERTVELLKALAVVELRPPGGRA